MDKKITKIFDEYSDSFHNFGEKAEEKIRDVEELLGIRFDKEYREYIMKYGDGGRL